MTLQGCVRRLESLDMPIHRRGDGNWVYSDGAGCEWVFNPKCHRLNLILGLGYLALTLLAFSWVVWITR